MKNIIWKTCLGTLVVSILSLIALVGSVFTYLAYIGIMKVGIKTILLLTMVTIMGGVLFIAGGIILYSIGDIADKKLMQGEKYAK